MSFTDFSFRNFLAGLAIVLFGMELLEDTIHDLSGAALKRRLKKLTKTPLQSIMSGFGVTTLLQSSSVTSLMILAFAGAWLMALPSAIWAIIGANVGSTMLGILVVYVGFWFKIGAFALSMIAIWWLMNKFLMMHMWKGLGKIVLSFGFMFFGISLLRDAVGGLATAVDFTLLADIWVLGWFIIGIVVTAVLHSSGAMSIIVLGLLYGGVIDFTQSMMLIAGANIGTCITVVRGALKWTAIKKQVAASHIIFNVVSWVLVLFVPGPLNALFSHFFDFTIPQQATNGLAVFQLVYNIAWAVLFYPAIGWMARQLQRIFHDEKADYTLGVAGLTVSEPAIALPVLKKDAIMLLKKIFKFNVHHLRIDQKALLQDEVPMDIKLSLEYVLNHDALTEDYHVLKVIEEELVTYIVKAMHQPGIDPDVYTELQTLYDAIERMMYAAKSWKDEQNALFELFQSDDDFVQSRLKEIKKRMVAMYVNISDIIDHDNVTGNFDAIVSIAQQVSYDNKQFLEEISDYLNHNNLEKWILTKLFHVSQSRERSNSSMVGALKRLFLSDAQRKDM
jgi:phosphate:Na+ symporter